MKQIWFCLPCQSLIGITSAGNSEIGSLSTFWCRYIYSLMMTQWSHKSKGKVQGQNKLQIAVNWENKLTIQMRKRNSRSITEERAQVSEHSSKKMRRLEKMIALGRNSFCWGAKIIFRFNVITGIVLSILRFWQLSPLSHCLINIIVNYEACVQILPYFCYKQYQPLQTQCHWCIFAN